MAVPWLGETHSSQTLQQQECSTDSDVVGIPSPIWRKLPPAAESLSAVKEECVFAALSAAAKSVAENTIVCQIGGREGEGEE